MVSGSRSEKLIEDESITELEGQRKGFKETKQGDAACGNKAVDIVKPG